VKGEETMEKGYSLLQTAEFLGIKVRTVRDWVHKGKIKATKITGSNRWVVKESEIKRLRGE
jgi:excisionase family DNA binding protein